MLLLARVLFIHRLVSATDLFVIEPFLAEIPVFLGSSEEDFDDDGIAFEDDRESSGDDHVGGQENIFDKLMLVPPPPPPFLFNFEDPQDDSEEYQEIPELPLFSPPPMLPEFHDSGFPGLLPLPPPPPFMKNPVKISNHHQISPLLTPLPPPPSNQGGQR